VSTHDKGRFPGVEHVEFSEDRALDVAEKLIRMAIENYPKRDKSKVNIPDENIDMVVGFTTEGIFHHLGGIYRATYRPLNNAIIEGRIRGIAAVIGCDNPINQSGGSHIEMVKELLANDVLVIQTGCAGLACGKAELLQPEAAFRLAGKGLQEVCEAVGIPPVLHSGACVDNSRILIECCEVLREGGLGEDFSDLPVAAAAPEWMSEKAIAIGWYAVATGLLVVLDSPLPIMGSKKVRKLLTEELFDIVGGGWAFESNPVNAANIMIKHINKKREALKLKPMLYEAKKSQGQADSDVRVFMR